jgi:hypothetical protein
MVGGVPVAEDGELNLLNLGEGRAQISQQGKRRGRAGEGQGRALTSWSTVAETPASLATKWIAAAADEMLR